MARERKGGNAEKMWQRSKAKRREWEIKNVNAFSGNYTG